jgi:hypothetical protein
MKKVKVIGLLPQAPPPDEPPAVEPDYTIGEWAGLTQWRCRYCSFDTLEGIGEMLDHLQETHYQHEPVVGGLVQAFNRFGNPI